MPDLNLRDGFKVSYTANPTDLDGNLTTIEAGSLVIESSDPNLVAVTSDGNAGGEFSSVPGAGLGTATVTVRADADRGEGVTTIEEVWNVTVIAGDAAALGGTIGPEVPR